MPKTKSADERKQGAVGRPPDQRRSERSSPGSGEDELEEAADLQPDEVEDGDDAPR
jgi:hypothetical protein